MYTHFFKLYVLCTQMLDEASLLYILSNAVMKMSDRSLKTIKSEILYSEEILIFIVSLCFSEVYCRFYHHHNLLYEWYMYLAFTVWEIAYNMTVSKYLYWYVCLYFFLHLIHKSITKPLLFCLLPKTLYFMM